MEHHLVLSRSYELLYCQYCTAVVYYKGDSHSITTAMAHRSSEVSESRIDILLSWCKQNGIQIHPSLRIVSIEKDQSASYGYVKHVSIGKSLLRYLQLNSYHLRYPIHSAALVDDCQNLLLYGSRSSSITRPSNPISLVDYSDSESEDSLQSVLLHETAHPSRPNMTAGSFRRASSVERSEPNDAIAGISVLSHGDIAQGTIGTCRVLGLEFPADRKRK